MSYQSYHIPANYTDSGKLFGLFPIRNAIEALALAGPGLVLCLRFLPFTVTTRVVIALIIAIPLGGFALIGIQDDPLTRFVAAWWKWRRGRGIITYNGSPAHDKKRKRPQTPTEKHIYNRTKAKVGDPD